MDLETVILSEVSQAEKDKYHDTTYMWNLKKDIQINLFIKQKQGHRCRKQIYGYQGDWRGRDKLGDWDYTYTLLCILCTYKQVTNKDLLHSNRFPSTGNFKQYSVMTCMGIDSEKYYRYITDLFCCTEETNTL